MKDIFHRNAFEDWEDRTGFPPVAGSSSSTKGPLRQYGASCFPYSLKMGKLSVYMKRRKILVIHYQKLVYYPCYRIVKHWSKPLR